MEKAQQRDLASRLLYLMRTLKEEEVYLHEYRDLEDARQHIGRFLDEVYMHKRVHSALGYVPPAQYEAQWYAEHLHASR